MGWHLVAMVTAVDNRQRLRNFSAVSQEDWHVALCKTFLFCLLAFHLKAMCLFLLFLSIMSIYIFSFKGSIPENEDSDVCVLGLDGNGIKCQTSNPHLHNCGNCNLSANHYILVNISFGQVTVMSLLIARAREQNTKKRKGVQLPFSSLSVNLQQQCVIVFQLCLFIMK